jgi:transmembrane sensor
MTSKDQVRELLDRYREGRLSPTEKTLLDAWYNRYAAENEAQMSEEEMEAIIYSMANRLPLETPKVKQLPWLRIAVAASIAVVLGAGSYLLLKPQHPHQETAQLVRNDIAPGHNQATLTLSNGQKIILTQGLRGQLAKQGGTTIQAYQHDIVYNHTQNDQAISYNTLSTARGEQSPYPLVLSDGTKVWLNTESSLTFPTAFTGKERIVRLSGEAYFEVSHNAKQPFKVQTGHQMIEDIGTQFDVRVYSDEAAAKTTLFDGSVKVTDGSQSLVLNQPAEQARSNENQLSLAVQVSLPQIVAWKNHQFRFEGEDIQAIMRELARWYDIQVSYQGVPAKEVYYAKISRERNISAVLQILEETKSIHFKVEGRRVTVIR